MATADAANPTQTAAEVAQPKPAPRRRSRLPRWTRREILVLIRGKREAEGRGTRRSWSGGGGGVVASPEPKWEAIASFCRRRGVERGAAQCQKRWSNLVGDFKKIKEWESSRRREEPSFWAMASEKKRERRLPGQFDRTVYDILDGKRELGDEDEMEEDEQYEEEEEECCGDDVVFDSGRRGESGLFSEEEEDEEEEEVDVEVQQVDAVGAIPISERRGDSVPIFPSCFCGGNQQSSAEQPEIRTATSGCHKKRRIAKGGSDMQAQLMQVFKKNNQMLAAHLEAHNVDWQVDRDLRRDQTNSVIQALNKIADALGKIAEKL